jgi:hypothetical protein
LQQRSRRSQDFFRRNIVWGGIRLPLVVRFGLRTDITSFDDVGTIAMMPTTKRYVLSGLAVFALSAIVLAARGAQQQHTRAEFMRTKLDHAKKVLEGLTLEDYDAIAKSARALRLLSQAAEWEVPTIPNATDYISLTREFQRYTEELGQKAKQKNLDGATLAYFRLTMSCVNCHKYVRDATR